MAAADAAEAKAEPVRLSSAKPTYGFNNAYSDFFRVWHGEVSEIISLPEPDSTHAERRREMRETGEEAQFDVERYLLDFANAAEDPYFQLAMDYEPFWTSFPVISAPLGPPPARPLIAVVESESSEVDEVSSGLKAMSVSSEAQPSIFSEADEELLRRLPRKEFLIPDGSDEEQFVIGGLVDILIGFVYEHLTSQGDSGIESTWTASILSPTLTWLDSTRDVRTIVRTGVRRMLSFPFLRQYELAVRVIRETSELLKRGKRVVLRALLELYRIVEKSETQYLLNALYIQDYCVWIQSVSDQRLARAGAEVEICVAAFTKAETGWALEELESRLFEEDVSGETSDEASSSDSPSDESDSESEDSSSDDEDDGAGRA